MSSLPPPPRFLPSIFIAHRVQQSHCSSIFHRVLLTHALALSASQFGAPVKLHVRARFFRFARKFNSDLCIAAPYVQVSTKRRLRCPDQPDPRHDPNLNPNPNPNPNPTLWEALGLLSRSAGVVLSLRAILKTLHVRAIIRLVVNLCTRTSPNNFKRVCTRRGSNSRN